MVAAAARDDTGILGIAFDAQVLAIRADEPGSCTADSPQDPSLGCFFNDVDITAGVDLAIASGARVINLSLGGESASQILLDAVARASAAGSFCGWRRNSQYNRVLLDGEKRILPVGAGLDSHVARLGRWRDGVKLLGVLLDLLFASASAGMGAGLGCRRLLRGA